MSSKDVPAYSQILHEPGSPIHVDDTLGLVDCVSPEIARNDCYWHFVSPFVEIIQKDRCETVRRIAPYGRTGVGAGDCPRATRVALMTDCSQSWESLAAISTKRGV